MVSNDKKRIAKVVSTVFGNTPKIWEYWDNNNIKNIDILTVENSPMEFISSHCTIGLSDYSTGYTVEDKSLRVEIVGAFASDYEYAPNILATCAFYVMNSNLKIFHGEILLNVVNEYYPESDMKHILLSTPFLWDDLHTLDFPEKKIAWLLAIPISEKEFLFGFLFEPGYGCGWLRTTKPTFRIQVVVYTGWALERTRRLS